MNDPINTQVQSFNEEESQVPEINDEAQAKHEEDASVQNKNSHSHGGECIFCKDAFLALYYSRNNTAKDKQEEPEPEPEPEPQTEPVKSRAFSTESTESKIGYIGF